MLARVVFLLAVVLGCTPLAWAQPKWVRDRIAHEQKCASGDAQACTAAGNGFLRVGPQAYESDAKPEQAYVFFDRGCASGDAGGCEGLAGLFRAGRGVAKDVGRAVSLFERACEADRATACHALADLLERGDPAAPRDTGRAASHRARARVLSSAGCEAGSGEACRWAGFFLISGAPGVDKDPAGASRLHARGCELGDADACESAAFALREPADRVRGAAFTARALAIRLAQCNAGNVGACHRVGTKAALNTSCEAGDPEACYELGRAYIPHLPDQPGDGEKAAHFFLKGCDADAGMCTSAGDLYVGELWEGIFWRDGLQTLPADLPRAAQHYRRACDRGDQEGCLRLARLAATGTGVAQDGVAAQAHFAAACTGGDPTACLAGGRQLRDGVGLAPDPVRAAALFARACTIEPRFGGCYDLGVLYRSGVGVSRDLAKARELLAGACAAHGHWNESTAQDGCLEACELDDAAACAAAGRAAASGSNAPQLAPGTADGFFTRAASLYDRRCEAGDGRACFDLGWLFERPHPHREDRAVSARAFERGCARGTPEACHEHANDLFWGTGQPLDRTRALNLYIQACTAGNADSCQRAGETIRLRPAGFEADEARAEELRQRAEALRKARP